MKTTRFALLLSLLVASAAHARSVEMEVNGLVCAFCAQGIQKAIRKFPATQDVFVNLDHRVVAIQLKDGQDIPDGDLRAAVTDAGYSTVRIERSDATLDAIRARIKSQEPAGD
ncbi:MAG: heavy-metal-associated domain-containing protein [Panacagrimonas sp.]